MEILARILTRSRIPRLQAVERIVRNVPFEFEQDLLFRCGRNSRPKQREEDQQENMRKSLDFSFSHVRTRKASVPGICAGNASKRLDPKEQKELTAPPPFLNYKLQRAQKVLDRGWDFQCLVADCIHFGMRSELPCSNPIFQTTLVSFLPLLLQNSIQSFGWT